MKYTKQEIDSMQDSEINACLAAKYFPESAYVEGDKVFYSERHDGDNVTSISTVFDFNSWQCIMPLVVKFKMDLLCGEPSTATISAATYFNNGNKSVPFIPIMQSSVVRRLCC